MSLFWARSRVLPLALYDSGHTLVLLRIPHTWIHLENNDPEATRDPGPWMVEGGTPNTLLRRGINRNSLVLGTDIIVTGYQSKDRLCEPTCRANGRDITFPDGRKLFMGSSGTGAPRDGADASEPGN